MSESQASEIPCPDCDGTKPKHGGCDHCGYTPYTTDGGRSVGVSDCPEVVCLCGSTRFKDEYLAEQERLTMEGKIFLTVGMFGHSDDVELSPDEKAMLDDLHKRKIDLADRVHVIDVKGYIGESTRSEIEYAERRSVPVTYYSERSLHTGSVRQ
jgi:hypothetical protein